MHEDGALFGDPRPLPQRPTPSAGETLPDWQIDRLRKGLDALGLVAMGERQALIEELAGRSVASLRDLTIVEARTIDEKLSARRTTTEASTGSAWDNRDEETWIDRL
ncbi:hypothetical protein EXE58_08270 [Nocardioides seonyuensis]|uniref:Uncharacterized protein n=1 Tax=Nocardioides seonyuensis TaxID=2518371 RepID=A0A4P7IE16_9ACTN|nr:hypothetical protein [Nocardioides seonyuensis]QBX55449.1 hypothetical protein EXE58_08270 [Nocardioides seonyuensis]